MSTINYYDKETDSYREIHVGGNAGVTSVNGQTGDVEITPDKIGAASKATYDDEVVPHLACQCEGDMTKTGWYRVAEMEIGHNGGYDTSANIFSTIYIKRLYINRAPESHEIKLVCADGGAYFIDMISYGIILCKNIRVMWDNKNFKYYLEIYYDLDSPNQFCITILNAQTLGYYWEKISPFELITDTASLEQLAECDISRSYKGLKPLSTIGSLQSITYDYDVYTYFEKAFKISDRPGLGMFLVSCGCWFANEQCLYVVSGYEVNAARIIKPLIECSKISVETHPTIFGFIVKSTANIPISIQITRIGGNSNIGLPVEV